MDTIFRYVLIGVMLLLFGYKADLIVTDWPILGKFLNFHQNKSVATTYTCLYWKWISSHDIKVGKGSREFDSTTARKVVQIASVMHH